MAKKIVLDPGWPRAKNAGFAQATQVGDTIYVAGQVAQDPDGKLFGRGDMTAQTRQVFRNCASRSRAQSTCSTPFQRSGA